MWGGVYKGVECLSPAQLCDIKHTTIVIVESLYYHEIKNDLLQLGIKNIIRIYPNKFQIDKYLSKNSVCLDNQVKELKDILYDEESRKVVDYIISAWEMEEVPDNYFEKIFSKKQYFDNAVIDFTEEEVMVDAGAYIGDSAEGFYEACKGQYLKMHLFELDHNIYDRLCNNMEKHKMHDIVCWPYGLGDKDEVIHFNAGDSNSTISNDGECQGIIKRLDDVLLDERVTFIKMDIEGAEMSALLGAKKIIQEQKPKLAICIYHSAEDMFRIPHYIKSLVPEYRLYIRHYTDMFYETVCYACI